MLINFVLLYDYLVKHKCFSSLLFNSFTSISVSAQQPANTQSFYLQANEEDGMTLMIIIELI